MSGEATSVDEGALRAFFDEHNRLATFDGRVKQLEEICRRTPGTRLEGKNSVRPEQHSRAWYAKKILLSIDAVRHHLAGGDCYRSDHVDLDLRGDADPTRARLLCRERRGLRYWSTHRCRRGRPQRR